MGTVVSEIRDHSKDVGSCSLGRRSCYALARRYIRCVRVWSNRVRPTKQLRLYFLRFPVEDSDHWTRRAALAVYTSLAHFGASLLFGLITAVGLKVRSPVTNNGNLAVLLLLPVLLPCGWVEPSRAGGQISLNSPIAYDTIGSLRRIPLEACDAPTLLSRRPLDTQSPSL